MNLLAAFTNATVDASIAVSDAKFAYLWWRPITAIHEDDGDPTTTRDYPRGTRWSVLTQENVDARVWVGAHYRYSDIAGATLGRRVADYDLRGLNA